MHTLTSRVVKQRLGHSGGFELLRQIGIELLARESLQVILYADALPQRFVHLRRKRAPQQRLADQQQGEIARGIHVEVQQQRKLYQGRMWQ
jgi:hypothetical protein